MIREVLKGKYWTVWSENMGSEWLETDSVDEELKETAWRYVDHCGQCGSCGGRRCKEK